MDTFKEQAIDHLLRRQDYLNKVLFYNSHLLLPSMNDELNEITGKISEYRKNNFES